MQHRDDESSATTFSFSFNNNYASSSYPIASANTASPNVIRRKSDESENLSISLSCTPEDERKIRRRILNRECARNLRARRLQYMQTLEQKVQALEQENQMLQMKLKLFELSGNTAVSTPLTTIPFSSSSSAEILQAIPLTADQVKDIPLLALEVDPETVRSLSLEDVCSSSSGSSSSSPNSNLFEDIGGISHEASSSTFFVPDPDFDKIQSMFAFDSNEVFNTAAADGEATDSFPFFGAMSEQ